MYVNKVKIYKSIDKKINYKTKQIRIQNKLYLTNSDHL